MNKPRPSYVPLPFGLVLKIEGPGSQPRDYSVSHFPCWRLEVQSNALNVTHVVSTELVNLAPEGVLYAVETLVLRMMKETLDRGTVARDLNRAMEEQKEGTAWTTT